MPSGKGFVAVSIKESDKIFLQKMKKDPADGTPIWMIIRDALDTHFSRKLTPEQYRHHKQKKYVATGE